MPAVYVAGVGCTRFGRLEAPLLPLLAAAAAQALKDAALEEVDLIVLGTMNPEEFTGDGMLAPLFASFLGKAYTPGFRVETGTSSGAAAFFAAASAIAAGFARTALVVAGEKMTDLPTPRVAEILSRMIDPTERRYGATMPALAAIVTRAYAETYHLHARELALVPVKNHRNGSRNPLAHFQGEITVSDVLGSRLIADPLRLYEVCPISDGAAAAVLTAERRAVRVAGLGQGSDHVALRHRRSLTSFRATQEAARRAYAMAGLRPAAVRVAEVHDAFTPFELITMEDLGLAEAGKAVRALVRGEMALEGRLPVNPSGGLKARGHPVGASGLAQIAEIVRQLRGEAGGRQVREARVGLAQSTGGLASVNWVTILARS
ncbi:MAG: thiolase domain-containing protein [candidate division NC10 bacterium]|nr:thiolase domain-containing protein [candidate division NC10 bacterium]